MNVNTRTQLSVGQGIILHLWARLSRDNSSIVAGGFFFDTHRLAAIVGTSNSSRMVRETANLGSLAIFANWLDLGLRQHLLTGGTHHVRSHRYDDLVTLRGALAVSEGMVSGTTTRELQALLVFTEARVNVALRALSEEDREEAIGSLDDLYEGGARAELEGFL